MRRFVLRQLFRVYVIALAVWGVWTIAWGTTLISIAPMTIAGGWLTIAGIGILLTVGLIVTREHTLGIENPAQRRRHERFANTWFNRPMLNVYAIAIIAWSVPTVLWWATRGAVLDATIVGTGWYAIAAIGAVVTVGLVISTLETTV